MRTSAGFHRNQAPWQATKEFQNLSAPQLLAKHSYPRCIRAMDLKYRLGQIQTNRTNFNHDAHPPMVASNKLTLPHTGIVAGVYIINAQYIMTPRPP